MKKTNPQIFIYLRAALILLGFLLPWISVSFFGFSFSVSGINIASGSGLSGLKELGLSYKPMPVLYIVLLLGIIAAFIVYALFKKLGSKNTGLIEMFLGIVPLVYGVYKFFQANQEFSKATKEIVRFGMRINLINLIGIGLWRTLLGFILITLG